MNNLTINFTVNDGIARKASRQLQESVDAISRRQPPPDYGNDDLHNARLAAAFHVRRSAWPEYMIRWKASLRWRDQLWLQFYEERGEWGNTAPAPWATPGFREFGRLAAVASSGVILSAAARQMLFDKADRAFAETRRSFVTAGEQMARSFAAGLQPADPEELLIMVERVKLRQNLERILIPAAVACWLARRWPVWALPAVAWVRLQNQMAHEGGIMLKWWRRLRG